MPKTPTTRSTRWLLTFKVYFQSQVPRDPCKDGCSGQFPASLSGRYFLFFDRWNPGTSTVGFYSPIVTGLSPVTARPGSVIRCSIIKIALLTVGKVADVISPHATALTLDCWNGHFVWPFRLAILLGHLVWPFQHWPF